MTRGRAPEHHHHRLRQVAVGATLVALAGAGAGSAWAASSRTVSASGTVKYVKREASTKKIEQRGTVTGSPFGRGTLVLRSRLAARKTLEYSVRLSTRDGVVTGAGRATLKASGSQADYAGTIRITGGTGRYRGISRSVLRVTGAGDSTARKTTVRITGTVRY